MVAARSRRSAQALTRWLARRFILPRMRSGTRSIVRSLTDHGADQILWRDRFRGVGTRAIVDAVNQPVRVVPQAGGKRVYRGVDAVVVLNQHGALVTAYAKGRRGWRWRRLHGGDRWCQEGAET